MIELEIKNISASDIGRVSLEEWTPQNPEDIWIPMSMEIGEKGDDASNIFLFTIATPEGIQKNLNASGQYYKFGRFCLIVKQYNWKTIKNIIQERVKRCQRNSWEESVKLLSRNFKWEYEDSEWIELLQIDEEE